MIGRGSRGKLAIALGLIAAHMLTDAAAIGLSLLAVHLAAKPARGTMTFGFKRAEILSAQCRVGHGRRCPIAYLADGSTG